MQSACVCVRKKVEHSYDDEQCNNDHDEYQNVKEKPPGMIPRVLLIGSLCSGPPIRIQTPDAAFVNQRCQ